MWWSKKHTTVSPRVVSHIDTRKVFNELEDLVKKYRTQYTPIEPFSVDALTWNDLIGAIGQTVVALIKNYEGVMNDIHRTSSKDTEELQYHKS